KILDFGSAKLRGHMELAGAKTMEGASIGTPQYIAPEQAAGESVIDHRSDLYSAGNVMYEMLSGAIPFKGETVVQTLLMHLTRQPPQFDPELGIPQEVADIVLRALQKEPSDRYESAAEFKDSC